MSSVVDFHTHILPRMDDGSRSVEQSVEMLRAEAKQGIERVVLTPHFYANHDSPERFLARRERSETQLLQAMGGSTEFPKLHLGAEVHYFDGMSDSEYMREMAIRGTNYVLVEMPMSRWTDRILLELDGIYQKLRLVPIVAHVDRYVNPFRVEAPFEQLSELNVIVQVNNRFFINRVSRRSALKLLSRGRIQLLGSDCHNMKERKPDMADALRIIKHSLGEDAIEYINSQENKIIPSDE